MNGYFILSVIYVYPGSILVINLTSHFSKSGPFIAVTSSEQVELNFQKLKHICKCLLLLLHISALYPKLLYPFIIKSRLISKCNKCNFSVFLFLHRVKAQFMTVSCKVQPYVVNNFLPIHQYITSVMNIIRDSRLEVKNPSLSNLQRYNHTTDKRNICSAVLHLLALGFWD